ncbi:type II secretion system F family protein [Pseudooctadecabacter sp.]|uniref:type II secretion system F family protein n=1 Tax=Pseudooctadecabacter sp. TaxID=1966338 RepID=UPI0035C84F6C
MDTLFNLLPDLSPFTLLLLAVAGVFIGAAAHFTFSGPGVAAERLAKLTKTYGDPGRRIDLRTARDHTPEGLFKALLPDTKTERTQVQLQLRRAGFDSPNAMRNFFLIRFLAAVAGPLIVMSMYGLHQAAALPEPFASYFQGISPLGAAQLAAITVAVCFYTPTIWLNRRVKARKTQIEQGFPNALDLLQISTEAGMGFDTSMTRVGQVLSEVCPPISEEFLMCQAEILAGRDRKDALYDMAERTGVEEAMSFAQLISQSMDFGTSISSALNAYAKEMRETREMKAVEQANKLPVKMSGVMASMMLPALFLITLGPTILRYMQVFGD